MDWQPFVLAIQILLLAAGWLLFQRARGELSLRAAESPVLAEVEALQKSVVQLLAEMETAADRQSDRLEQVCADAGAVLTEIEDRLRDAEAWLTRYENALQSVAAEQPLQKSSQAADFAGGMGAATFGNGTDDGSESPKPTPISARLEALSTESQRNTPPESVRDAVVKLRDMVCSLADRGESPAAIARTVRLSEGEVETVLGLRPRR